MKRLIHICFWHRNIIFETARHRFIHFMNDSQSCITIFHRINNNSHSKQIINLINILALVFHLFVNTKKMLHPPIYLCFNSSTRDMFRHLVHNILHVFFPCVLFESNLFHQIIVGFWFKVFQRQIIKLNFNLGDTKSLRKRGINIQCLPCNTLLAFWRLVL